MITFRIFLIVCVFVVIGCQTSNDPETQRKQELKREALKLEMGMTLAPEDAKGHLDLGTIYHDMGRHEKAIEEFQAALRIDEGDAQIHNNLGLVYTDLRMFLPAFNAFKDAIEIEPDNPVFHNNLGYAYDIDDQFEKAVDEYRQAIELDPEFQEAYYNLAEAYRTREHFEESIEHYQKAIALNENDADAHYGIADAYHETEQLDLSIQSYEKALSLNDTDVEVYYQLARVYHKKGDRLTMKRYIDMFTERAANRPEFIDDIEQTKQMLTSEPVANTRSARTTSNIAAEPESPLAEYADDNRPVEVEVKGTYQRPSTAKPSSTTPSEKSPEPESKPEGETDNNLSDSASPSTSVTPTSDATPPNPNVNTPKIPTTVTELETRYKNAYEKLYAAEKSSEALREFQALTKANISHRYVIGNAHFWAGMCYIKLGQSQKAIAEFQKVTAENSYKHREAMAKIKEFGSQ